MTKVYKMSYRQRVYKNPKFPNERIQHMGEGPLHLEWPDGKTPTEDQIEEDSWVQVERTVSDYSDEE